MSMLFSYYQTCISFTKQTFIYLLTVTVIKLVPQAGVEQNVHRLLQNIQLINPDHSQLSMFDNSCVACQLQIEQSAFIIIIIITVIVVIISVIAIIISLSPLKSCPKWHHYHHRHRHHLCHHHHRHRHRQQCQPYVYIYITMIIIVTINIKASHTQTPQCHNIQDVPIQKKT